MRWNIEEKKKEFLELAKIIHENKYDYETYPFLGMTKKMKMTCPTHGVFEQVPKYHIRQAQGCPRCGIEKRSRDSRIGVEEFVNRAREIHSNKYNYDEVVYEKSSSPVKIGCPVHGIFEMRPECHVAQKQGCPKCGVIKRAKACVYSSEQFVEKARMVHGDIYDYSLVDYRSSQDRVTIICQKHGEFEQVASSHASGHGCPKCFEEIRGKSVVIPFEEFVDRANVIHNNQYHYLSDGYTTLKSKSPISIVCKKHGAFLRRPQLHLRGDGCPYCADGTRGFRLTRFIERCNHYGRLPSLYLVKIQGREEEFIKIGVTSKNVKNRFYSKFGYKYREILTITGAPDMIWTLEKDLHAMFRKNMGYIPLNKFPGSGECYDFKFLDEISKKIIEIARQREGFNDFTLFPTPNPGESQEKVGE
jgi:hypothetical protein